MSHHSEKSSLSWTLRTKTATWSQGSCYLTQAGHHLRYLHSLLSCLKESQSTTEPQPRRSLQIYCPIVCSTFSGACSVGILDCGDHWVVLKQLPQGASTLQIWTRWEFIVKCGPKALLGFFCSLELAGNGWSAGAHTSLQNFQLYWRPCLPLIHIWVLSYHLDREKKL